MAVWKKVAVPLALALAKGLFDLKPPAKTDASKDLSTRLAALEETQRRQAEAVHALAEQTTVLVEAAEGLRRQVRTLLVVAAVAGVLALVALVVALLR